MTSLTIIFVALFIRLGFWQIQRSDEKATMVAAEHALAKQEPYSWQTTDVLPKQYQRIKIAGTYLDKQILLDNQHHLHQFGYDVLSPLLLSNGDVVIIDRGWLSGDNSRRSLPVTDIPKGEITVQGMVYFPSKKQWILGAESEERENKITIIELLDTKLLSQLLQKKVYPFIIRLNKQDAYGFVREWEIVSMPPQRHLAYALQWFAMALVILIIFVALNLKKKK